MKKVGTKIALEMMSEVPNLSGPTKDVLLLLGGVSREIDNRNSAIMDLLSELEVTLGFFHSQHAPGTLSSECSRIETCRRVWSVIKSAEEVLARDTAYPLPSD